MGIALSIDFDVSKADAFTKAVKKQLPFATSLALNDTGFDVRQGLNQGTLGAFHKPVKFTQKAFLVKKSKKR